MSKFGYNKESNGKQVNIVISNTSGENIINNKLPEIAYNSIIIATQCNNNTNEDTGIYSIIGADNYGESIRFTYTMIPGNGLYTDGDIIYMNIDNTSLITDGNALTVNLNGIVDNECVTVNTRNICINSNNIGIATESNPGIVIPDNSSVKVNNTNQLYVETNALTRATDELPGIISIDANTIISQKGDGVISVDTSSLRKCTNTKVGIAKCDGTTLSITNDMLTVNVSGLNKPSSANYGVIKTSETISSNDGVLSVNVNKLTHATNTTYGVIKIDDTFEISDDGMLGIKKYTDITKDIDKMKTSTNDIDNLITSIQEKLNKMN
jgi:hypothetical protein